MEKVELGKAIFTFGFDVLLIFIALIDIFIGYYIFDNKALFSRVLYITINLILAIIVMIVGLHIAI